MSSTDQKLMELKQMNDKYKLFVDNYDGIVMKFPNQASVSSLAREAIAKSFISPATFSTVTNKAKTFSPAERADQLLLFLHMEALTKPIVFSHFLESLEGKYFEDARCYLEKSLEQAKEENIKNPEASVILLSMNKLVPIVTPSLPDISARLRAKFAISADQHSMVVDPEHEHAKLCLTTILKDIGEEIRQDPERLNDFVQMLENMGAMYYKDVCDALKEDIN